MFTDSKIWTYRFSTNSQKPKAWKKAGESAQIAVAKSGQKVHAYGGICHKGSLGLYFVSGTTGLSSSYALLGYKGKGVNSAEYGNLLMREFLPAGNMLYGGTSQWVFMQDGAAVHTAKTNMDLLRLGQVEVLEWPPNSPDLNPIENAWGLVQREMNAVPHKSFEAYKQALQERWKRLSLNIIQHLIADMDKRLEEVLEAGGGSIDR